MSEPSPVVSTYGQAGATYGGTKPGPFASLPTYGNFRGVPAEGVGTLIEVPGLSTPRRQYVGIDAVATWQVHQEAKPKSVSIAWEEGLDTIADEELIALALGLTL